MRAARDRAGAFNLCLAGLTLAMLAGTAPASAQWIGTPGGGATSSEPAPAAAAPVENTAPASITVAPATPAAAPMAPPASSMDSSSVVPPVGGFSQGGFSQGGGFAQPGMDGGMGGGMGMPQQPSAAAVATMKECQTSVNTLREDLESRVAVLQTAGKKKAGPSELCPLIRNYVTAQQKFFNYLSTNKTKCQVPDEVVTNLKKSTGQSASMRDKICKAAQMQESGGGGASGPPPQGAVSAGLGLSSGLPSSNLHTRPGGVFDTLGGSALR